jgi:hypothetical protein
MTTRTFFIDLEEPLKDSFQFSDNKTTSIDLTLNRYNKIVKHIDVRMELTIGHVGVKAITGPTKTFYPRRPCRPDYYCCTRLSLTVFLNKMMLVTTSSKAILGVAAYINNKSTT